MRTYLVNRTWQSSSAKVALCFALMIYAGIVAAQDSPFADSMRRGAEALRTGDVDAAVKEFASAAKTDPGSAEAHFNLGLALIQAGHQFAAKEQFERAAELKPAMKGPHLFLGIALYRTQDFAAAEKSLRAETKLSPVEPQAWMWLGVVEMALDHDLDAVDSLKKAQALKPDDQDILYHLGRAYMQASKLTYQKMYEIDPNSWRVHQVLAQGYHEAGRQEDAIAEYKAAIAANPARPELHMELGDLYRDAVQLDQAEHAYRDELKVNPGNEDAAYRLANILLDQSQPQDAISLLSDLLKNNSDSLLLNYQMGRARLEMGDAKEAVGELNRVTAHPAGVDGNTLQQAYFYLSRAYLKLGDRAAERQALASFSMQRQKNGAAEKAKLEANVRRQEQKQQTPAEASPTNQP
jgi:tetratricopeptide (TPR) repeat protein